MKSLLIIEKMKKIFKNIFSLFITLIVLAACQNMKDGLTGKKKSNTDEFLVKKKSPLVLPPEFTKLPVPGKSINNNNIIEDGIDIEKILTENKSKTKIKSVDETPNASLEKSIIEKIKSN
jgi:competence transcription factor ComK|tara:strand:+ start:588 stop:947 length:360 start_codon:yes stop_codon:yes gene_type:complete